MSNSKIPIIAFALIVLSILITTASISTMSKPRTTANEAAKNAQPTSLHRLYG